MRETLVIALGGAVGAVARFWVGHWVYTWLGRGFPYGTLAVNVIGSLAMGVLFVLLAARAPVMGDLRALVLVGFLGAFTTFSTFSMDTVVLLGQGAVAKAAANVLLSVVICIGAAYCGYAAARQFVATGI